MLFTLRSASIIQPHVTPAPAGLVHMDWLAPVFINAQELRVMISALLDRFPGKEPVVPWSFSFSDRGS